ncbi:MAG: FKBP-type peptidyl-prolyl cis-trans isomerase [Deltaproteobacteria bacterium]
MKSMQLWAAAALFATLPLVPACQQGGASASAGAPVTLQTEEQKTYYALGLMMGGNLKRFKLTPEQLEDVKAGLSDQALGNKPQVELQTYGPKVQQMMMGRASAMASAESGPIKEKGKAFRDEKAKLPGAVVKPDGLVFITQKPGTGPQPAATDTVKVNYEGKLPDGTVFDSSYKRGQPAEFPLKGVVPCWTEGLQLMHVGETAELICPSDIAYGDRGHPPTIPGGSTLDFKVELLSIKGK